MPAEPLDRVLAATDIAPGTVTNENLLTQVTWEEAPPRAYFQCRDRAGNMTLELWYGPDSQARGRGQEPQPLLAGTLASLRILSYFNDQRRPAKGVYLIQPTGTTSLFRVNHLEQIPGSSIRWDCEEQDWQEPEMGVSTEGGT